ncbi:hypothetical protein ACH36K_11665 [Clostridium sp. MB05]|uniref:hypothetical protein n=1 Tax=Clostridium sp. MB05 TaxID=3376682 RepID=UPI00398210B8
MLNKKKIERSGYGLAVVFFILEMIILYTYREITLLSNLLLTIAFILLVATTVYKYCFNK